MQLRNRATVVVAVVFGTFVLAAFVLSVGGRALRSEPALVTLAPDDVGLVETGREVYAAHCAACHGVELEGQPDWRVRGPEGLLPAPPHDETGHTWHHADAALFEMTKFGPQRFAGPDYQSAMPAYEGVLSDAEIAAVLSFIKSTWPPDIRARHDAISGGG